MTHFFRNGTASILWAGSVLTLGLVSQADSVFSWVTLTLVAVLPPAFLMYRSNEPVPSMSYPIQKAPR